MPKGKSQIHAKAKLKKKPQKMYAGPEISTYPKAQPFLGSFSPVHLALVGSPEIFNADISDCGSDFILKSPALFLDSICRLMVYPGVVCLYMLPVPHQVAKTRTLGIFIFGNVLFAIKDFVILVD